MNKIVWKKLKPNRLEQVKKEQLIHVCNRISVLLHILACLFGYFVIEAMSRHSVISAWNYLFDRSWVFLYNSFLIFLTTLPVYLIKRRTFYRIFIGSFWLILGLTNCILLMNRVTPFTGPDLKMFSEGLGILNKYMPLWQTIILCALLIVVVILLVLLFIKAPKFQGKVTYKKNIAFILVVSALFAGSTKVAFEKRLLSNYFGNIAFAYQDYGYPYCLAVTLFDTGISSPRGYSESLVKHIVNDTDNKVEETKEKRPNIIFVQLESFFDPKQVRFLKMSEDPIPYFRSLMKDYSSGSYVVPSVGAGTANTEFETITGMSMRYFGPGEYPYKSILKESTCESAPYVLNPLGYTSHAVHNNEANFYSRRSVFSMLGFNTFTSEEYMPEQSDVTPTGWIKDKVLTSKIMDCLESTSDQDFVFTISVQGHGAYPEEPTIGNPEITVSGASSDEENCAWEYYVNEIHEMDNFVKNLVKALEEYQEDTVLVLYGDHLPTMGLQNADLIGGDLFKTKYVIWDNMGLKEQDKSISAYQMMAEVLDRVEIHEGTLFKFHQEEKDSELYQIDLQTLQYDMLYGDKYVYGGESPFLKTELKLGIKDVKVSSVIEITDGMYYVRGENFTPSTVVLLNDEIIESSYVNQTALLIQDQTFENGDQIGVAIQSNSSSAKILSTGNTLSFYSKNADTKVQSPYITNSGVKEENKGTVGQETQENTDTKTETTTQTEESDTQTDEFSEPKQTFGD